jgi:lysine biosynthesis protein LysW
MKTAKCPECSASVEVEDKSEGPFRAMQLFDIVDCDACGSELKILNLDPLRFHVVMTGKELEEGQINYGHTNR